MARPSATEMDELQRLRNENTRLKQDLGRTEEVNILEKQRARPPVPLSQLAPQQPPQQQLAQPFAQSPFASDFDRDMSGMFDQLGFFRPFGCNMFGGGAMQPYQGQGPFFQRAFSMGGPLMADTQANIAHVQRHVEAMLEAELGEGASCDDPVQQSYSSTYVNGVVTTNVGMVCTARSPSGDEGEVHARATVKDGAVTIDELTLKRSTRIKGKVA
ncbi:hypothetical protein M885DRAFT_617392 [Pelagophyceae sp. CCMP2097]|nr:hypothetical protein M885DRAFT_617392 [Pelagophyceae sp. CCMP2097]|mmetsp:Transcript_22333/g.75540  ORF Transcript_22333/g.75540 Transcript_22333/m.75540 type:complete len:215 (+) Transcript_22333:231-875(+)